METSSSSSINSTSNWAGNSRNQQASAADPMAFFDLIMKTSQSLSGKGKNIFDPAAPASGKTSVADEPYTAVTDDPSLHDDHYEEAASAVPVEAARNDVSDSSQRADDSIDAEDVAAVAELSEKGSNEEDTDNPDQAALETAAASQQEQTLATPEIVATTEGDESEVAAEQGGAVEVNQQKTSQANAGNIDTDQPLDTSPIEESATDADQENLGTDANAVAQKSDGKDQAEAAQQAEQITTEVAATDESQADHETVASADETNGEELTAEQTEDASAPEIETTSGEEASGHDSSRDNESRSVQRRTDKPDAKVDAAKAPAEVSAETTSNIAASSEASEAVAAAAAASAAARTTTTPGGSTSNTNGGVNNIASLLQRGMQRGTLQKTTEGKPSTQLDSRQQIRLINRVARAVESTPPGQSIKIRLNPSELGQLKVEIKVEDGNMIAKIEAENTSTRQVLLDNLPQLRERLAESNINVQQFEVELMGQQTSHDGAASDMAGQSSEQGNQRTPTGSSLGKSDGEEATPTMTETVNKEAERDSRNLNITI
ncbi:flagellar hook-length control protein FliK [Bremerella sp. JC817]|uniref:flagellar hook-length control protein FliK n=1 Tax=Bremerella sp. JC817 TaxID=3231756 RepID=UPI0034583C5B